MAEPDDLNKTDPKPYEIEGIGHDFVPSVCHRDVSLVDSIVIVFSYCHDLDAVQM